MRPWECSPSRPIATSNQKTCIKQEPLDVPSTPVTPRAIANPLSPDAGYFSDITNNTPSSQCKQNHAETPEKDNSQSRAPKRCLEPEAVRLMESWYRDNFHHPYPSAEVTAFIVHHGHITKSQVKKWMANKRVRSYNTLSYNGTIHPKRLNRLRKEYAASRLVGGTRYPDFHRPLTSPLQINTRSDIIYPVMAPGLQATFPAFMPQYFPQRHFMPLCLLPNLNNVSEK